MFKLPQGGDWYTRTVWCKLPAPCPGAALLLAGGSDARARSERPLEVPGGRVFPPFGGTSFGFGANCPSNTPLRPSCGHAARAARHLFLLFLSVSSQPRRHRCPPPRACQVPFEVVAPTEPALAAAPPNISNGSIRLRRAPAQAAPLAAAAAAAHDSGPPTTPGGGAVVCVPRFDRALAVRRLGSGFFLGWLAHHAERDVRRVFLYR